MDFTSRLFAAFCSKLFYFENANVTPKRIASPGAQPSAFSTQPGPIEQKLAKARRVQTKARGLERCSTSLTRPSSSLRKVRPSNPRTTNKEEVKHRANARGTHSTLAHFAHFCSNESGAGERRSAFRQPDQSDRKRSARRWKRVSSRVGLVLIPSSSCSSSSFVLDA